MVQNMQAEGKKIHCIQNVNLFHSISFIRKKCIFLRSEYVNVVTLRGYCYFKFKYEQVDRSAYQNKYEREKNKKNYEKVKHKWSVGKEFKTK